MPSSARRHHDGLADARQFSLLTQLQADGLLPDVAVDLAHRPALEERRVPLRGHEAFPGRLVGGVADGHG